MQRRASASIAALSQSGRCASVKMRWPDSF